jgi:2-methylcitrate synthase
MDHLTINASPIPTEEPVSTVPKGLDGVAVDETAICLADKATDRLYYRGYAIEDLAEHASYEEVAYLLLNGELPSADALDAYRKSVAAQRALPAPLKVVLGQLPPTSDPMDVLRTGMSVLGSLEPETKEGGVDAVGRRLMGCLPGVLLHWFHRNPPESDAASIHADSAARNLLLLLHGKEPSPLVQRAMEVSLIVYAEHDFNASTFAARVAASTLTDAYSAYVAAISALRGPLHGSANAAVLRFLKRYKSADEAEAAVKEMLTQKARIPGFGQRAYGKSDPRNAINKKWAKQLAESSGNTTLYEVADRIEGLLLRERGMFANLDYYTALIYDACGLPMQLFPPMFMIARLCGLTAHIAEQRANNRIIHPSSRYVGPAPRAYVPLSQPEEPR